MKTKIELKNGNKISAFVELHQLKQDRGGSTWRCRYSIKGKQKVFSANRHDSKNEALITINRKIHDVVNEEKIKSNRSTAPTLTEIAKAYLAGTASSINASQDTRKLNLSALSNVTKGIVPGGEPKFKKLDDGSYKLVDGGFWDNFRLDKLVKRVAKDFLDSRMVGYKEKTDEWYERARGANDRLRQARGVFTEQVRNEIYVELFNMPDLEDKKTGFLKARYLKTRKKLYKAPKQAVIDEILEKVGVLKTEDPDIYGCFLLQYGCGLSWGEVMHAQYSWLAESDTPNKDGSTRYEINVQPVADWVPKCERRERSATVPSNIFQKILDLRYAKRPINWREEEKTKISDQDLAKLVWSKPCRQVAKELGVTSSTVCNYCNKRGIRKPESGFWTKVRLGQVEHPNGNVPADAFDGPKLSPADPKPNDGFILQRHRCDGYTGANRRLARWFRENITGWDRKQVGHELRKINISMVICSTGSLYQGSKHAGHSSYKTTEECYGDLLEKAPVDIPLPENE